MAGFDVVRHTELDAQEAWRRVTDWERHGQLVPLTVMRVDDDPATDEVTLVARTAVGPMGFDDVMAVTFSRPPSDTQPGVVRLVKRGRVVPGWAVLTVTAVDGGSEVRWHEEARVRGSIAPTTAVINLVVKGGFRRLLASLLFETTATDPATYALVIAGTMTLALVAGLAPARRATRVDPMTALRNE